MDAAVEIILLLGAGLIAGAINSLAGGGSFIAFPALLLAGVPPVLANATNTFAAWPGYISGAVGFWPEIRKNRRQLVPYILAALVGGFLGAELLLRVSDAQFSIVVPWLMGVAVLLFAVGGRINKWIGSRAKKSGRSGGLVGVILLLLLTFICLYGGFFNAGLGIILLAFFALAGFSNIHAMNGMKLLLSAVVATIAVVRFALSGSIAWYEGSLVFAGALVGGYVAARLAKFIPENVLRISIIIYGTVLTVVFFWQAYGG
ncbi:MAG: sulfite exporter TauE/SafE family protein [Devosiaceae bacterium]|nr:sulfite exporter TauE/SafE family protein [Devosiaceae bacterium]